MTSKIIQNLQPEQQFNCLIGDVGGTNVRLQIIKLSLSLTYKNAPIVKQTTTYNTRDFPEFQNFIVQFLQDVQKQDYPLFAVIGIAGPIANNTTSMANTDWPLVDGNAIGQALNIKPFILINDFQAVAYGILGLQENDLIQLNPNNPKPKENQVKTVLGPGTGLGVSRLIPALKQDNQWEYNVWPCEGGHVSYSPSNDLEIEYLIYLRKKLNLGQIVAEKAMAGQAVPLIYLFLKQKFGLESQIEKDLGQEKFDENKLKDFPSKQIFEYGVQKKDELCQKVVDFFLTSYGTVIGDLVCNTSPLGGMYLFGGVSISVADYIIQNPQVNFLQDYIKYRPHLVKIFDQIPIYVIKQDSLGLEGAYQAAYRLLENNDTNKGI